MASPRIRRVLIFSADGSRERDDFDAVIFGSPGNDAVLTIARNKWPLRKLRYKYGWVERRRGEEVLVLLELKGDFSVR